MPNELVKNADLKLLMIATFRYSLGRRTYMPGFITEFIINNHNIFHKEDWKRFIQEIEDNCNLGDSCDIQTWNNFTDFCKGKLNELEGS